MIIGIDLGTTYSAAAWLSPEGPKLIPNALGEALTPSCVGWDAENHLLVGRAAKELQVLDPARCASLFKRYMGSEWSATLGNREFTAEQLSSLVLKSLKDDAEAHLAQKVERAVITVPAYFNDNQRKATLRAGEMAGFKVERILNEPTAAAIAYGLHEGKEAKIVVVFDLGGGTFDVSVVELFEGAVEVRASSGECFLGGEDFTKTLAARVLEQNGGVFERTEMEAPLLISRLLQLCEKAKCRLSSVAAVTVALPNAKGELNDASPKVTVTREQFAKWTDHILARTELPIRRGLGDANLKRSDVNEVILVGGATRMPAVVERVTRIFGQPPHSRLNPDEVVALGAAVQAGLIAKDKSLEDLVVTDVCPFTLGIEITKRLGLEHKNGYYMPMINRNTTIPTSRVERVHTLQANQTSVRVKVFQGESRRVKDNLALGELEVKNIPRGPAGQEVDVRFTYDLNGVLEVEATVVETGMKQSLVITRHVKGLNAAAVAKAVEEMQAIKRHPREETMNRYLIKRAERVYQELPLMEREALMDLLDGFEGALELQEPDAIERHRQQLQIYLECFDRDGPADQDAPDEGW